MTRHTLLERLTYLLGDNELLIRYDPPTSNWVLRSPTDGEVLASGPNLTRVVDKLIRKWCEEEDVTP